jgi:hypothetical protein
MNTGHNETNSETTPLFKCPYHECPLSFRDEDSFMSHKKRHKRFHDVHCSKCPKIFQNGEQWYQHVKRCEGLSVSSDQPRPRPKHILVCNDCGLKFSYKNVLIMHIKYFCAAKLKSALFNPYSCNGCGLKFTSKTIFTKHVRSFCTAKPAKPNPADAVLTIDLPIEPCKTDNNYCLPGTSSEIQPYPSNLVDISSKPYSKKIARKKEANFDHQDTMFVDKLVPEQTDEDWVEIIELNEEEVDCFAINTTVSLKDEPIELEEIGENLSGFEIESAAPTIKTEIKEESDVDFEGTPIATLSKFEIKTEISFEEEIIKEPQDLQLQLPIITKAEMFDEYIDHIIDS